MPHSYGVSLAGVRFPVLPTSTLTTNAEAAKRMATRICRRTGKYSRSIRNSLKRAGFGLLFYTRKMAIMLGDRTSQSRRQALVFLAVLLDRPPRHEILQFLISSQAQHFLATAGSVPGPKVLVHDVEQLLKFERRTPGEDSDQLLSYQIRKAPGECIFL